MNKIDTHLHLIYPNRLDYPWLESVPALKHPFTLGDYAEAAKATGITEAIFMEVDVTPEHALDEVNLVRTLAGDATPPISGIIAAARPESDDFAAQLNALAGSLLKGIRRVLHTQEDSLSTLPLFRRNVASLGEKSLTFDLCVLARQLPLALELVDDCPQTQFILDHCGVPDIAGGDYEPWAHVIRDLAKRDHVACKISGLPTYCKPGGAAAETLRPWVEHVIESFGWDRVVWGGDWPVATLNGTLLAWSQVLNTILSEEPEGNQEKLYSINARRIYHLA